MANLSNTETRIILYQENGMTLMVRDKEPQKPTTSLRAHTEVLIDLDDEEEDPSVVSVSALPLVHNVSFRVGAWG